MSFLFIFWSRGSMNNFWISQLCFPFCFTNAPSKEFWIPGNSQRMTKEISYSNGSWKIDSSECGHKIEISNEPSRLHKWNWLWFLNVHKKVLVEIKEEDINALCGSHYVLFGRCIDFMQLFPLAGRNRRLFIMLTFLVIWILWDFLKKWLLWYGDRRSYRNEFLIYFPFNAKRGYFLMYFSYWFEIALPGINLKRNLWWLVSILSETRTIPKTFYYIFLMDFGHVFSKC